MTNPTPTPRTREEIDAALRVIENADLIRRVDRLERRVDRIRARQQAAKTPTQTRLDRLEERVEELEQEEETPPPAR